MSQGISYVFTRPADVLRITGADRVDLLHRLSTQDLRPLRTAGCVRQTLFTTQQGKLVDWTRVFALEDELWLLASSGRAPEVKAWIDKYTIMEDVVIRDAGDEVHAVVLLGAHVALLANMSDIPAEGTFVARDGGIFCAGLAALGPSVLALLPASTAAALHQAAVAAGATAADASTVERLRLEAGVPGAEFEFREQVNPLELRLTAHAVGWNKGCYIGQEVISRLDSYDKVARVLMGFECDSALAVLPEGTAYKLSVADRSAGRVTSWINHGQGALGLALVKREVAVAGAAVLHGAHGATLPARLMNRPFFM